MSHQGLGQYANALYTTQTKVCVRQHRSYLWAHARYSTLPHSEFYTRRADIYAGLPLRFDIITRVQQSGHIIQRALGQCLYGYYRRKL